MEILKKKQHYVWRYYLKPWVDSHERIKCYLKDSNKFLNTGLMSLALEKYFYRLESFTDDELQFLKKYIDSFKNNMVLHGVVTDLYELYSSFSHIKKQSNDTLSYFDDINEVEINSMENIHCEIEKLGNSIIGVKSLSDLSLVVENELCESVAFLCIQYFRTKKHAKILLTHLRVRNLK